MNIFQNIINKKRGHNFALSHYGTSFSTSKDYFFHVSDKDDLSRLTPRIPSARGRAAPTQLRRRALRMVGLKRGAHQLIFRKIAAA